ncbi:hypothetical protein HPP92_026682 [Vanilla planifolia]|uniref:Uncharacterized protein n=1 Tax=Vanilla planifolia TaxID=51239 RepID=A0A835PBE4_VANPL|nr:hypothetical protein HPP92_026682 [Vanilla planifolia]
MEMYRTANPGMTDFKRTGPRPGHNMGKDLFYRSPTFYSSPKFYNSPTRPHYEELDYEKFVKGDPFGD